MFSVGLVAALLFLFAFVVALIGVGVLVMVMSGFTRARTVDDLLGEGHQWRRSDVPEDALTLGKVLDNEYEEFPPETGVYIDNGEVKVDPILSDYQLLFIGSIGSGKSTGIVQYVHELVRVTKRVVYIITGKPSSDFDAKIRAIFHHYRKQDIPVIRIGGDKPGALYNGLRGLAWSISNRLVKVLRIDEYDGPAEHYADLHRACIDFVCLAGARTWHEATNPPYAIDETEGRFNKEWFDKTYPKGDAKKNIPPHPDRGRIDLLLNKDHKNGTTALEKFVLKFIPILVQFRSFLSASGHALEDGSAIWNFDTAKNSDIATRAFDFFVEDLKSFMGSDRQTEDAAVFIDEYHAFKTSSISEFFSQSREFRIGGVIATQGMDKLGTELEQKQITTDTTTIICFRTDHPEAVCKIVGTRPTLHLTYQHQEGELTGLGSIKPDEEWIIHPQKLRRLGRGEAYLIRHGRYVKFKFYQPKFGGEDGIPWAPPEPSYTPPPQPAARAPEEKPRVTEHA